MKNVPLFEARFILPETTPDGFVREDIHQNLEEELMTSFGNFIVTPVETFKKGVDEEDNPIVIHDDSLSYEVLIRNTALDRRKLADIALAYGNKLEQSSVYYRLPNGEAGWLEVNA